MASDLSKLIQDSFTLTLNGLLAKDAKILKITKAHPYDMEDTQFLQVQSLFDFTTFSSKVSYLVPAKSASLIFNTMMGSPITDLLDEIDDDAEDAIGEFISNTSGGLTTSINGTEFEDIGQTKFNISHKEILDGNQIQDLETTFRFLIDLEDEELIIFVAFDDAILPFIEEIMSSEITFHQERAPKIEEEEELQETVEEIEKTPSVEVNTEEEIEQKDTLKKPNDKKIKQLIVILGASISFIILVFLILYFMGLFDPEPVVVKQEDLNVTKKVEKVSVVQYKPIKKVNFKSSQINKERLNSRLQDLTKYSVLTKEELLQQKEEEKLRLLDLEREKKLIAFAKKNLEEPLKNKEEENSTQKSKTVITDNVPKKEIQPTTTQKEIITTPIKEEIEEETLLRYVQTSSLKYRLFKSVVQQTNTAQARISICNNKDGKTTIYIGPFENESLQKNMVELTKKEVPSIDISIININENQFNTRCNIQ